MSRELRIGDRVVDDHGSCFVIAEIGHNHQGHLEKCFDLFEAAAEAGADAVKLQKRDNKSLFTRSMYDSVYTGSYSFGYTYGAHREALEFGKEEYEACIKKSADLGMLFMSTAFDFKSADFLAGLDVPAYKLASGDLTNTPLLKHVASLGKPMLISTGGGTMEDVRRAYDAVMPLNSQVCVMQCTSGYPADWHELNLRVIESFRIEFPEAVIGFSSHDNGIAMPLVAYVLGARIVEKHFTLNRALKGSDHAFSLEPQGLRKMVRDLRRAEAAMGDGQKRTFDSEIKPLFKMGKKLVAAHDLPAGHVLTVEDIAIKSPNDGLPPYEMERFVGQTLVQGLAEDEGLSWAHIGRA